MDEVNEFIGNERATAYSYVELHLVNGRTSLFPENDQDQADVPEDGAAAECSGQKVPFGERPQRFGKATRANMSNPTMPAMVTYIVDEPVTGFRNANAVKLRTVNTAETLFSTQDLAALNLQYQIQLANEVALTSKHNPEPFRPREKVYIGTDEFCLYDENDDPICTTTFLRDDHSECNYTDEPLERGRTRHNDFSRASHGGPSQKRAASVPAYQSYTHIPDRIIENAENLGISWEDMEDQHNVDELNNYFQLANEHVAEYALSQPGGMLYQPSTEDVLREAYKAQLFHLFFKKRGRVTFEYRNVFRRYLRYTLRWNISLRRLTHILFGKHSLVSMGLIPITGSDLEAQKEFIKSLGQDQEAELPQPKARENTKPDRDAQRLSEKEAKKELVAKQKRTHRGAVRNFHQNYVDPEDKVFVQKTDTSILMNFRNDPRIKSEFNLRHTFNYQNAATPNKQPRHIAEVKLTYANAREEGDVPITEGDKEDIYQECHRIINVTHPKYDALLKRLYPHACREQPNYFDGLRASIANTGHGLYLFVMPCNEMPFGVNVFTLRENMPPDHDNLATALKYCPTIFMLVRGSDVDDTVQGVIEQFKELAHYNPMSEFFNNAHQQYMNNRSIRETSELPRFSAPVQHAFENYGEFEHQVGISALLEHRFHLGKKTYTGNAACIPIPASYNSKSKLHMAYQVTFTMDSSCSHLPGLTPHSSVHLDFTDDENVVGTSWFGRVTSATSVTGIGEITMCINRPVDKEEIQDLEQHSTLTDHDVNTLSTATILQWAREQKMRVKVYTDKDNKEVKRLGQVFERMRIPKKLLSGQEFKENLLATYRQLMTCNDHTALPSEALFTGVKSDELEQAKAFIYKVLRPYQADVVRNWEANKVFSRLIALGGPSGSGKTTLALFTLLPYMLNIGYSEQEVSAMNKDYINYLTQIQEAKDRKAAKEAVDKATNNITDHTEADPANDLATTGTPADTPTNTLPKAGENKAKDGKPKAVVYDKGRLTLCAIQNETVDSLFSHFQGIADQFAVAMDLPRFFGIRLHSEYAEINAVLAMMNPDFDFSADEDPYFLGNTDGYDGPVSQAVLCNYITQAQGSLYRGIKDRRFKKIRGSMAIHILQLTRVPGWTPDPALESIFLPQELNDIAVQTKDLVIAYRDLRTNKNIMTPDIAKKAKTAARIAYQHLLAKASYLVCTLATATTGKINIIRQATAVACEESGRANGADMVGLFSQYPFARLHVMSGDWKQLPPMMFGPDLENNFYSLGHLSLLSRLYTTGFHLPELPYTSRFKNGTLLEICRLVNDTPELQAVDGSLDDQATAKACRVMHHVWGKPNPALFINVAESTIRTTAAGSCYNVECAIVALHSIGKRLEFVPGKHITYMTPYNAQLDLVKACIVAAMAEARAANNEALAERWASVVLSTVDSYMGCDNKHVIVDLVGTTGFVFERPRWIVANTRGTESLEYIGDSILYTSPTSPIEKTHSLHPIIRLLNANKAILRIDTAARRRFTQFGSILEGLGLETQVIAARRILTKAALGAVGHRHLHKVISEDDDDEDRDFARAIADARQHHKARLARLITAHQDDDAYPEDGQHEDTFGGASTTVWDTDVPAATASAWDTDTPAATTSAWDTDVLAAAASARDTDAPAATASAWDADASLANECNLQVAVALSFEEQQTFRHDVSEQDDAKSAKSNSSFKSECKKPATPLKMLADDPYYNYDDAAALVADIGVELDRQGFETAYIDTLEHDTAYQNAADNWKPVISYLVGAFDISANLIIRLIKLHQHTKNVSEDAQDHLIVIIVSHHFPGYSSSYKEILVLIEQYNRNPSDIYGHLTKITSAKSPVLEVFDTPIDNDVWGGSVTEFGATDCDDEAVQPGKNDPSEVDMVEEYNL